MGQIYETWQNLSMSYILHVLHIEAVSCERLLSTELLIVVAIQWAPL